VSWRCGVSISEPTAMISANMRVTMVARVNAVGYNASCAEVAPKHEGPLR
jgi:hypothetical protein